MWSRLIILCALSCMALGAPHPRRSSTSALCPEPCECVEKQPGQLHLTCRSADFLEKLQPKQVHAIASLDLSGNNLTQLHTKLRKLRNLERLNLAGNGLYDASEVALLPKLRYLGLSGNHIKHFAAHGLSGHLVAVDLSRNYLTNIPRELHGLPHLKELRLFDNPIACTCEVLKERDLLAAAGVDFVKPVLCHSPEKLRGQLLKSVSCAKESDDPLDRLLADEPVEGSGDESEPLNTDDVFSEQKAPHIATLEEEELLHEFPKTTEASVVEDDEGSGDGGNATNEEYDEYPDMSGDEEITTTEIPPAYIRPKACNFDCTTPLPLDEYKGENGTDPDLLGEIGKDLQEIFPFGNEAKTSTTEEPEEEEVIEKRVLSPVVAAIPHENEKMSETIVNAETDEIKETNQSGISTNLIIIIALIALMLCLVAFSIIKKRNARKPQKKVIEQEMKPLNAKPTNTCSIPEKTPLMNGQNGNMNGKPVDEPVARNDELDPRAPLSDDDVELRGKNRDDDQLLPGTHRVTIQAKELSTPKTPLLVNRVRSDDGQIITTSLDRV